MMKKTKIKHKETQTKETTNKGKEKVIWMTRQEDAVHNCWKGRASYK